LGSRKIILSFMLCYFRLLLSHDATFHQLKVARDTATALVQNLMPQFFLRRMKSLIAHQLPKKSDRVVFCHLTEIQKDAYTRFLESDIVETVRNATELCPCESGKKSGWCCSETLPGTSTSWKVSKNMSAIS
jgi:SNF2 family DNA or RNA helicase